MSRDIVHRDTSADTEVFTKTLPFSSGNAVWVSSVLNRVLHFAEGPPPDGSWTCESCGNVNYPFRTKCNRRNCGADKPTETKPSNGSNAPALASDQVCGICDSKLLQVKVQISEHTPVIGVEVFGKSFL
jgi:hypothetical protein